MGTKVVIPTSVTGFSEALTGTVEGIGHSIPIRSRSPALHRVFSYIVILDKALSTPYGDQRALSIPGTVLEAPDGSNWKLDL